MIHTTLSTVRESRTFTALDPRPFTALDPRHGSHIHNITNYLQRNTWREWDHVLLAVAGSNRMLFTKHISILRCLPKISEEYGL